GGGGGPEYLSTDSHYEAYKKKTSYHLLWSARGDGQLVVMVSSWC
ncbi:hypothetical protein Tco_0863660, partial [Tanacetum coccineum]